MDVIHNVFWRIAFLVERTINYCLQLCFLALNDSRSGVLICIIVRTNRRQSESQTLKQENENEKHWHSISQQNKKCWEILLNSYISLKCSEGMWPQPENEDTEFSCETKNIWNPVSLCMLLGNFSTLLLSVYYLKMNATLCRVSEKKGSESLSILKAPDSASSR